MPDSLDPRPANETIRPEFNPSVLVNLVMMTLGARYGIATEMDSDRVAPAVNAAADLLRALGVVPTAAPTLPGRAR